MFRILIIGYGNLLRGDDAIGCHAAHALEEHFRDDAEVEVIAAQQLTPEMAEDISAVNFVLFIDATHGEQPGAIARSEVSAQAASGGLTHNFTPASLLSAAGELYGDTPAAMTLTMAGWSFELGNKLSRGAILRMPELLRQAKEVVEKRRPPRNVQKQMRAK